MVHSSQLLWQINPACRLFWKQWEDCQGRSVLFNEASGQTHWLNELSSQALKLLASEPLTSANLMKQFMIIYEDFPSDDEMDSYIEDMLLRLEEQGLIEPAL